MRFMVNSFPLVRREECSAERFDTESLESSEVADQLSYGHPINFGVIPRLGPVSIRLFAAEALPLLQEEDAPGRVRAGL